MEDIAALVERPLEAAQENCLINLDSLIEEWKEIGTSHLPFNDARHWVQMNLFIFFLILYRCVVDIIDFHSLEVSCSCLIGDHILYLFCGLWKSIHETFNCRLH